MSNSPTYIYIYIYKSKAFKALSKLQVHFSTNSLQREFTSNN